ncbi:hypothetical protein [Halomicrobium salinisoli]|uniref:hypothetical protein n=1 Tax=Halomicrobium salinisoli TaxID=2878391 RepID=UPI001CEFF9AD|nr:hypothetical protein [Halomicrobium salinisoli]
MDRRSYLSFVGAAAVAGCTESSDGESGATDTPTEAPTPTATQTPTASADARDAIEQAEEDLNQAITLLQEETDTWSTTGDASISTKAVDTALANAREALDRAEESANGDQQERVDVLRSFADFVDKTVSAVSAVGDGINEISTAVSYENTGRYKDGAEALDSAASYFGDAHDQLTAAGETFSEIKDQLPSSSDVDLVQSETAQEELVALADAYQRFAETGAIFDRGLADYYSGVDKYNNENFSDAEEDFSNALEHFQTANDQYSTAEDEVPQEFVSTFIEQTCGTRVYSEASNRLVLASQSAAEGNYEEASNLVTEAESVLNENCTA